MAMNIGIGSDRVRLCDLSEKGAQHTGLLLPLVAWLRNSSFGSVLSDTRMNLALSLGDPHPPAQLPTACPQTVANARSASQRPLHTSASITDWVGNDHRAGDEMAVMRTVQFSAHT